MTDERIKEDDFINIKGLKFKSPFEMMKWITKAVVEIEKLKEEIEEQRKLIEPQYAENQTLGNNNATLIHRLGELSEQVEKMKCCGKLKWHDLRKNPDDLPERIKNCNHTHEVLRQDGVKVRYNYYREAWQYFICDNLLTKCEVIAWCEVPKFEGRK